MPQTIDTRRLSKTDCCGKPQDCCPVCGGLTCLDRPRFFAGQLLTEAELNSEQAYMLAKNRLHNRYLHGYGIVCGLWVSYHDCPGWVTVQPGYALDACGNDILVCAPHDFDLIKAINDCRDTRRRPADCDPWRQPVNQDCQNLEEDWLITIRYKEKEGQPTTALVSCSPFTCGCESGNGGSRHAHKTSVGRPSRSANLGACEPSRIIESFEVCVAPMPSPDREPPDPLDGLDDLFEGLRPEEVTDKASAFRSSVSRFQSFATRRENLQKRLQGNAPGQRQTIVRDLSRFREDLRDELLAQPRTQGDLLERLAQVYLPPASEREGNLDQFQGQAGTALNAMSNILVQHLWGFSCLIGLPTCPPDVCDDRLALAQITVKENRIVRICHIDVRRHITMPKVSVPFLEGWIFLECCKEPDAFAFGHITNANAFTSAAFAHMVAPPTQAEPNMIETAPFVGRPLPEVRAALEQTVPRLETLRVQWNPGDAWRRAMATPMIRPGALTRIVEDENGNVLGFELESDSQRLHRELSEANERISRLESRLEDALQAGGRGEGKGSGKRGKEKG